MSGRVIPLVSGKKKTMITASNVNPPKIKNGSSSKVYCPYDKKNKIYFYLILILKLTSDQYGYLKSSLHHGQLRDLNLGEEELMGLTDI